LGQDSLEIKTLSQCLPPFNYEAVCIAESSWLAFAGETMAVLNELKAIQNYGCQDLRLRQQVAQLFANHKFPALRSLEIMVDQGCLTLTGLVRSFHEKQMALCLCRRVDGISECVDQIEVHESNRFNGPTKGRRT